MDRILIIGSPGSGKSTLSLKLSSMLNTPVVHLDKLFWKEGWVQRDKSEFDNLLLEELKKEKWIIDGNYSRTMKMRMDYADLVILLDYPRWVCLWRVIKRVVTNYGSVRRDMGDGCPERFDWEFLKYVWNFPKEERGKIVTLLNSYGEIVLTVHNKRDYNKLLKYFDSKTTEKM